MSRERRAKHETTPRPNERRFFKFRNSDAQKESKGMERKVFKTEGIMDVVSGMDDPFRFTIEEWSFSDEESDTDDNDEWSTYKDETSSDSEDTVLHSPEKMRLRDDDDSMQYSDITLASTTNGGIHIGNPKFASTGIQDDDNTQNSGSTIASTIITKNNFGKPKFASTGIQGYDNDDVWGFFQDSDNTQNSGSTLASTINGEPEFGNPKLTSTRNKEPEFGNPKLTSTRNEGCFDESENIVDPHFEDPGNTPPQRCSEERENIVDSYFEDPGNTSPQLPVGIDENYIEPPSWKYYDNQDKEDEDFIRTIITTGVDDVFKNSNDTSSLKPNDAVILSQETSFRESQTLNDSNTLEDIPEEATLMRKKKLERKRHLMMKSIREKKKQDSNLKQRSRDFPNLHKKNKTRSKMDNTEYEEYLGTLEVCPLSLSKAPFTANKRLVNIEVEERSKREKGSVFRNKRRNKGTHMKNEEFDEYEKYLQSLLICPLSIKKSRYDSESLKEN